MTLSKILLPIGAALLLAGCGGSSSDAGVAGNRFPEEDRQNFLAGCEDNGAPVATCGCVLSAVERRWSRDEFEAILERMQAGGEVPAEFNRLAVDCAKSA